MARESVKGLDTLCPDPIDKNRSIRLIGVMHMMRLIVACRNFAEDRRGATMVEYGLMLALIAVVCLAAVNAVGSGTQSLFNSVSGSL